MMSKRKDTSPSVNQKPKISNELLIREKHELTQNQKLIIEAALDKNVKCIFINGPAGSAKTYCSILASLKLLSQKKISEIVYIRSLIQAKDGETGYLSGDIFEKTQYFNIPLIDKLEELLTKPDINLLVKEERIKTYPTSMLRGYNFNATAVILDEAQNCSRDSIVTAMTRLGQFSKIFVIGDSRGQNDYGNKSGFDQICKTFNDEESAANGIRYFQLEVVDIVRSPFVKFIVDKLSR